MTCAALVCFGVLSVGNPEPSMPAGAEVLKAYESEQARAGRDAVSQIGLALWCEARGLSAERLKHLARAVLIDPDNAAARGLMGLMAYRGRWESPEAVSAKVKADEALTARLADYNARREELEKRADQPALRAAEHLEARGLTREAAAQRRAVNRKLAPEHVKLGMWCEKNGLKAEAVAHFTQAVVLDPYREATWHHLGYTRHNGRWMTREQVALDRKESSAQRRADRYWEPLLRKWRAALGDKAAGDEARGELATVTNPRAVPSVMKVFARGDEADQALAVKLLGQIDAPAATRALASLAVFATSDRARWTAAEALRRREPRDYAEALVDHIRAPMRYRVQPVGGPGSPGAVLVETPRFKMLRTYDAPVAVLTSTLFYGSAGYDANGLPVIAQGGELDRMVRERPFDREADLAQIEARTARFLAAANLKAEASQQRLIADVNDIETTNAQAAALNQRISGVLQAALDAPDLKDDEDAWHTWYYDKVVGYRYESPPQEVVAVHASPQPPPPVLTSCFAAGTLVRTIDGRRPIESLHVGDQVLTQDPADGALSYQPVLVVHHNPPTETVKVTLDGGETVTASVYHRFWRAGRGWAIARELKPGDVLRTFKGRARVTSAESGPVVPVFNLDVAKSRTYFVGQADALVHDNTLPDPHQTPFDAASVLAAAPAGGR